MTHRTTFPNLLQQALDLTKIVASEAYHVYPDFLDKNEGEPYKLVAYLDRVREASLAAMEVS
jgi:nuclear pore complex protein Nup107